MATMAEVMLSPSPELPFGPSPLSRSTSHPSLLFNTQSYVRAGPSHDGAGSSPTLSCGKQANSPSSSAPPSTRISTSDLSSQFSNSTPPSSLSLQEAYSTEDEGDDDDEDLDFPVYDHKPPPPSESSSSSSTSTPTPTKSPAEPAEPTNTPTEGQTGKGGFRPLVAEDDFAVKVQPTRHVDYLSYNWTEEDIWSSWKHIITKRGALDNWERLENASWRTWAKSRNKLQTVSPQRVNWYDRRSPSGLI